MIEISRGIRLKLLICVMKLNEEQCRKQDLILVEEFIFFSKKQKAIILFPRINVFHLNF